MEVPTLTIVCHEGSRPPMTSSSMPPARGQYLLDLLAQIPDPRRKRGRRHLEPVPEVLLHPSVIERFARYAP
jgi:hypothetical protein